MVSKVLAIIALILLPLSVMLWRQSVASPVQHRLDVTLQKSLRIYLIDGVCGLRLLSLPTRTASKTGFRAELTYNPAPKKSSLILTTTRQGPHKVTWLVFPLWLTTGILTVTCCLPVITGPMRRWWRRWRGRCAQCGYDLRGNRSGRCSECGWRFR